MTVCDPLPSIGVRILSRETTEETMVGKLMSLALTFCIQMIQTAL